MSDRYTKASPNVSNMSRDAVQVSGKTINAATDVLTLHGNAPAGKVIVGWAIDGLDDQEAGANRGAILVGDSTAQKKYIDAGQTLDTQEWPVHDPSNVYVKGVGGAVANVVVTLFVDNTGQIDKE